MKIVAFLIAVILACGSPQIDYRYEPGELTWTSMQRWDRDNRKTNGYLIVYVCQIEVTGEISGPHVRPWGFSPETMGAGMCFAPTGTPALIMWQDDLDTATSTVIAFKFENQQHQTKEE